MALKERIARLIQWVTALKAVRVVTWYGARRGPLLSQGLSYQAIFAVFAALWVAFAVAGGIIRANPAVEEAFYDLLRTNAPGLIDDGSGDGAISVDQLLSASILGWTGIIAAVALLVTALGWLSSGREAVRAILGLPGQSGNPILLWLKDLGLAIGFGAAVLVSAGISALSTTTLEALFGWAGVEAGSVGADWTRRIVGIAVALVLDSLILVAFYRVVSGVRIPLRLVAPGAVLAAAGLGALKVLGTALLGGATNNPLLVGFAVIIGLLIWFNLVCQVILLGSAWIAVSADDRGVDLHDHRREADASEGEPVTAPGDRSPDDVGGSR